MFNPYVLVKSVEMADAINPEFKRGCGYMTILGIFIKAVATILNMVLVFYMWIIIARAVLSWASVFERVDPFNPIVRFLNDITEPVLKQVRVRMPNIQGVDLSPVVVLFAIFFLQMFVVDSLLYIARQLM